jgi:EpsI family protein
MKVNRVQALLAAFAILMAGFLAEALKPRQLMASASSALNLEEVIPRQFGQWKLAPDVGLVTPSEPAKFVQAELEARIYSQEVARGYVDRSGNVVMLLVAYGPVQDYRLKSHLPEVCYGAAGFRVSKKDVTDFVYRNNAPPLALSRMVATKEGRFEPISYWMRVGNDVATGVFDRQMARLKYGVQGLIPDGALFRVSTIGISKDRAYLIQDQFIRDLIEAIAPEHRKFFVGT